MGPVPVNDPDEILVRIPTYQRQYFLTLIPLFSVPPTSHTARRLFGAVLVTSSYTAAPLPLSVSLGQESS